MNEKETTILITGGTGSFGKKFIEVVLTKYPNIKKLIIFSRDELKQWELKQIYPENHFPQLRFFLGDIRDKYRLTRALEGVDIVIHAAALKQVPAAEYNPFEFIRTNVIGSDNLINACLDTNVKVVISLSTDKASSPINLYGASKLCADKLFIAANNIKGSRDLKFSVVRYGNVMGSRGSVIPLFIEKSKKGKIPVTDINMTRFNITLKSAVDMVLWSIDNCFGGEIIVPKIPSYKILDLVKAIGPNCELEEIGPRPGEKIHEEMISIYDSPFTLDIGNYFLIFPSNNILLNKYEKENKNAKKVPTGFSYSSEKNTKNLTFEEIRDLIKLNINESFKPF